MLQQISRGVTSKELILKTLLLAALALLWAQSQAQQAAAGTQSTAEVTTLELGKPIHRELAHDQTHTYQLPLAQGQYANLAIEQRGIDVAVRTLNRDGRLISEVDSAVTSEGTERVELIALTADIYLVKVIARFNDAPVGNYEIRVQEIHPATENQRAMHEARSLRSQAARLRDQAKESEGLALAERALAIAEKVLGPDDPYVAEFVQQVADICHQTKNEARAQVLYERALATFEKEWGPEHYQSIETTRALGAVYAAKGDVAKADKLLRRALELGEKTLGPEHARVALFLRSLGGLYLDRGDFARAAELFERALTIIGKKLGPEHKVYGELLNNLGVSYLRLRDYERADQYLVRALGVQEKLYGPDASQIATVLQNLGIIARDGKKDYASAEKYYLRALAIREKNLGPDHPDVAWALNNIGNLCRAQGNYAKALETFLRALRILDQAEGPGRHALLVGNIARTYAAMGDLSNAIKFQALVDAALEKDIDLNLAIGSERQRLAFMTSISERTDRSVSLSLQLAPNDAGANKVSMLALLQRKGRVLDGMTDTLSALRQRAEAQDQVLLDQLNETKSRLAQLVFDGPQKMSSAEYQSAIKDLEDRRESLESEISQHSAEFRAQSQPVTVERVQATMPKNAALIEFVAYRPFYPKAETTSESYGDTRYAAFVVRPNEALEGKDLGDAKAIDIAVDAWRQTLRDPLRRDVRDRARAVDEKIMQPVRAMLGDATQLLISPDGELNLIPFQALVDEQGSYLLQRYSFAYLTSGRDLLRMRVVQASRSNPVVVADPTFGEPGASLMASKTGESPSTLSQRRSATTVRDLSEVYFAPLSGTALEADTIEKLFPDASLLAGPNATESAVKRVAAPRLLHIATHGFFLNKNAPALENPQVATRGISMTTPSATGVTGLAAQPATRGISSNAKIDNPLLRSGLALAGANLHSANGDDGLLTALEASGLNLWGTKLVVLSACDTGLGEVRNGEGVYGLRRAFVLAGAESLVMSLWPASDYTTRKLMTDYYKNLKKGLGRGEALREVQLDMLKHNKHLHPFYWANFIQSGEWANLDGQR